MKIRFKMYHLKAIMIKDKIHPIKINNYKNHLINYSYNLLKKIS